MGKIITKYIGWGGYKGYKIGMSVDTRNIFITKNNDLVFYNEDDSCIYEFKKINDELILQSKIKTEKSLGTFSTVILKDESRYYVQSNTDDTQSDIITTVENGRILKRDTLKTKISELQKSELNLLFTDYSHEQPTRTFFRVYNNDIYYLRNTKDGTMVTKYEK
jgi:hypothetical protein